MTFASGSVRTPPPPCDSYQMGRRRRSTSSTAALGVLTDVEQRARTVSSSRLHDQQRRLRSTEASDRLLEPPHERLDLFVANILWDDNEFAGS